ncbi:c-type cytochrome [Enhydrobacter sp.]|jgi:cytochrome c553|uniref:c-type cytochrome n=1 Tax=Enhydrobacter sp. TaxID=1894999 RepID=UPI0026375716|nr:c-type cytochrome [Enhydrobacter sp.]WIM10262.1 MAG: Cytochrome c4 [Enhydrobacter sp.]
MSARSSSVRAALMATGLLLSATAARAAEPPATVKDIVETCASCHGQNGVSAIVNTPSLAGQPDIFLQYQLVFIRDGVRPVEVMQQIAKTLSDDNIRDLGAYYAALPPPSPLADAPAVDVDKVKAMITQRHCDSCHKEDFSGQGETARLAGQRPDYLVKALHDFRAGVRRGRGMGAMMEVSVTLQDQDIEMIAAYLASKP